MASVRSWGVDLRQWESFESNWSRGTAAEKGKAFVAHISSKINTICNVFCYHFHTANQLSKNAFIDFAVSLYQ